MRFYKCYLFFIFTFFIFCGCQSYNISINELTPIEIWTGSDLTKLIMKTKKTDVISSEISFFMTPIVFTLPLHKQLINYTIINNTKKKYYWSDDFVIEYFDESKEQWRRPLSNQFTDEEVSKVLISFAPNTTAVTQTRQIFTRYASKYLPGRYRIKKYFIYYENDNRQNGIKRPSYFEFEIFDPN